MKEITKEMREALRKPLPKEAISQHPTKKFLSTIKAIYVVERLNDVFGIGEWKIKHEVIEIGEKMIVVKGTFTVNGYDIEIEQFGGNDNADRGDAFKGACTDALTKIGSYLEVGIDVFKGYQDKVAPKAIDLNPAIEKLSKAKDTDELTTIYKSLKPEEKSSRDIINFCTELKPKLMPVL